VLCLGNAFRGDDAIGVRAASELRKHVSPDIAIVEQEREPTSLLEVWDGADLVIVVDAVRAGGRPGPLVRREVGRGPLARSARPTSSHGIGLAEIVSLAGVLGRLPRRMIVWGCETKDFDIGTGPSTPVLAALPAIVKGVLGDLEAFAASAEREKQEAAENPDARGGHEE
jgi:hydrogenase maturation protease